MADAGRWKRYVQRQLLPAFVDDALEDGLIVAVGLTTSVADTPQAVPMVAAVTAMTGEAPGCALMARAI